MPSQSSRPIRILAVDDDPAIRSIYRRVFAPPDLGSATSAALTDLEARLFGVQAARDPEEPGFDLSECSQGDEAVEVVEQSLVEGRPFAIAFVDVRMPPGPDGVWVAEQVRALDPRVEIVIVTAYSDVPPEEIARRAPPARQLLYVQKPFTLYEIRQLAVALGEKWRMREAETKRTREEIVLRLAAAAEARHQDTGAHLHRIGAYAAVLARACGWGPDETETMRVASMLHDVGKIGVPDEILQKPGRLTDEEMRAMRTHSEVGARLLEGSDLPVLQMALEIARSHHEWWDGAGYPQGLSGEDIPPSARIVAVVDVYDALVHDRVYRPAFPEDRALSMMREGRGRQFDPFVFDRFNELVPQFRMLREQINAGAAPSPALVALGA